MNPKNCFNCQNFKKCAKMQSHQRDEFCDDFHSPYSDEDLELLDEVLGSPDTVLEEELVWRYLQNHPKVTHGYKTEKELDEEYEDWLEKNDPPWQHRGLY